MKDREFLKNLLTNKKIHDIMCLQDKERG
jgi:hypothetical protein